jgi:Flp pilus assembly protein TadD
MEHSVDDDQAFQDYQEGMRLLEHDDAHAAAVILERARDRDPDKGSVREALGRAYLRTHQFLEAGEEFAKAVELEPVNDYALYGLGVAQLTVGDHLGARRHLRLATVMAPDKEPYRHALLRAVRAAG